MQKLAESLNIGRALVVGAALFGLVGTASGCKPDKEPEHPYGQVPSKPAPVVEDAGAPAPTPAPPAEDAKVASAKEADAKAPEAADAKGAPAGSEKAADAGAAGSEGSGTAAGQAVDLSSRFYALVGLRLVGKDPAGVQRWLFKQNGFFERELHGEDKVVTVWNGTWKLDQEALALTYKQTVRGADGAEPPAATDGTVVLPVAAVGKLKLSIGGVTVAVDLDE